MSFYIKRFLMILIILGLILFTFPIQMMADFSINSENAIVMDQQTGRVFYGKNEHEKQRIASITKIMTAIIAIESGKLDELVTVSNNAVKVEGSSIYLKPNEKIKLEDLVYGLMLRSGNDAAVAIAEHVGGSLEGFVFLMNEKAAQLGMTNTHFANPHGLDDHEDHYSTAYDMALLTRYAMENEKYREIAGTPVHYAPNPDSKWDRKWTNKHRLVTGLYKYTTGGKTGYTKRAHRTLVSTAKKDDMELIAVTLHSPSSSDWYEHIEMFEHVFNTYQYETVLLEGVVKQIKDPIYKNKAYLADSFIYPLSEEEKELFEVKYRIQEPEKRWKRNPDEIPEIIGKAEIYFNNELLHTMPVFYKSEEEKENFFERAKNIFTTMLGVVSDD